MKEVHTEIEIGAIAERVRRLLTDFASYPEWNPFIRHIGGSPTTGERLEVRIEPPGARGMTFWPTVLRAEPYRELRWLGRLLVPGLFDGEHSFTIQPLEENRVRFVQREGFKGLLVPLFAQPRHQHAAGVRGDEPRPQRTRRGYSSADLFKGSLARKERSPT